MKGRKNAWAKTIRTPPDEPVEPIPSAAAPEQIAQRLRLVRIRSRPRFTQTKLAARLGITPSSVSQWERGNIKSLKWHNAVRICSIFGVTLDWLVFDDRRSLSQDARDRLFGRIERDEQPPTRGRPIKPVTERREPAGERKPAKKAGQPQ